MAATYKPRTFAFPWLSWLSSRKMLTLCVAYMVLFLERLWGVRSPALDSSQACAAEEDENGKRTLVFYLLAL